MEKDNSYTRMGTSNIRACGCSNIRGKGVLKKQVSHNPCRVYKNLLCGCFGGELMQTNGLRVGFCKDLYAVETGGQSCIVQ